MSHPILQTHQLSYFCGEKPLIESIQLSLKKGSLHALLGLNGSGKSTLLRTISRIWEPSYGSVLIDGEDTALWDRRRLSRTISLVPQAPSVAFNYKVDEMVKMGYYSSNGNKEISINEALESVDALHLRHRSILSLSAGERQRVYIARALITAAPILLFDEPTSALDIRHQLEMWRLLRSLADKGHLIIVATHDLKATITYCNSASLMHRGSCLTSGSPDEVLTPEHLQEVFGLEKKDLELLQIKK